MTLAQERAAIGAGVRAARANTLRRDLNSLETQRRKIQALNTMERRGARPATKGRGLWNPAATGTGGGVASPLDEQTKVEGADTVPDRDYWPDIVLTSSDGIFTYEVPPVKTLKLKDANEADVIVNLAQPVAP